MYGGYLDTEQDRDARADCECLGDARHPRLLVKALGMDGRLAEVTLLACPDCGRYWLHYLYEEEAFTSSGRWYLGAITDEQVEEMTAEAARRTLEGLAWYFYGGSYYGSKSGRTKGEILF